MQGRVSGPASPFRESHPDASKILASAVFSREPERDFERTLKLPCPPLRLPFVNTNIFESSPAFPTTSLPNTILPLFNQSI